MSRFGFYKDHSGIIVQDDLSWGSDQSWVDMLATSESHLRDARMENEDSEKTVRDLSREMFRRKNV